MSFYADVICKSPLFKTTQVVKDLAMLEPFTRAAVLAIIRDAAALGHDVRVSETYRSCERQAYLYRRGATKLKAVGCHHYGIAADLGIWDGGKYDPNGEHYRILVPIIEKHGLISGWDWGEPKKPHTFRDAGHVQRVAIARQPKLFAGAWYPDPSYSVLADLGRAPAVMVASAVKSPPKREV
ncbi:MAG: D-alanyl-D-alanine carboxypeptidase [Hyphomicrobiales bacterium]|nr:D-alanyl-D-alanine carboxypeptidase [Hyphomicrobiales bacterium]